MAFGIDSALQGLLSRLKPPPSANLGNSYLDTGGLNPNIGKGTWEDYVRQLGFSNLENMTDFQSPLYQGYAQFLQKTTPGIGANTLLGSLIAGGNGFAGGMNIANQKAMDFARERQDAINNSTLGFFNNNQQSVMGQLGQIGGSFQATADRVTQQDIANQANSPWNMVGNAVGGLIGLANPLGGGSMGYNNNAPGASGTAGYSNNKPQPAYNSGYASGYWSGGGNPMNPWMR